MYPYDVFNRQIENLFTITTQCVYYLNEYTSFNIQKEIYIINKLKKPNLNYV